MLVSFEQKYGPLVIERKKLGTQSFAAFYCAGGNCVYSREEKLFYEYNWRNGKWESKTDEEMISTISTAIYEFADVEGLGNELASQRKVSIIKEIMTYMKALAGVDITFFQKKTNYIHCADGMLELSEDGTWIRKGFSAQYHSRNQCELSFDPDADCPRFKNDLLRPLLDPEDIDLLQLCFGQCLLGINLTQTIFLMTGSGGSGKGTLANILERVVGSSNWMQIRPEHIAGRFETSSFFGKTLLSGKESNKSFFTAKGMGIMKSLVGDDTLRIELKHSNEQRMIRGAFNIFIVGNTVPVLEFESHDDLSAWHRRLRWIKCRNYVPPRAIDHFCDILCQEEGSGILNWCLEGAKKIILAKSSRLPISQHQEERLSFLFRQSFQMEDFLRNYLEPDPSSNLTVEEIYLIYIQVAELKGWQIIPQQRFQKDLPEFMQIIFHENRARDIPRIRNSDHKKTNRAGFRHVRIKKIDTETPI